MFFYKQKAFIQGKGGARIFRECSVNIVNMINIDMKCRKLLYKLQKILTWNKNGAKMLMEEYGLTLK